MTLTLDNPSTVPAPAGPYAHVARVDLGDRALLILSGQIAVDENGETHGDIVAQSEQIFALIAGILEAHGSGFEKVAHIRTFMTNLDDLPGYATVRRRLFPRKPASTTVEVSRLFRPGALLEVEVTAVAG